MRLDRAQDDPEPGGDFGLRPNRERIPAAAPQYAKRFGHRRLGPRKMKQPEVHHNQNHERNKTVARGQRAPVDVPLGQNS